MTVIDFLTAWNKAELAADTATIADALTDDFTCIGPLGFTLSKQDWINRHGNLHYDELTLEVISTRTYGDTVVVIGTQNQRATFNGNPIPGTTRASIVVTKGGNDWKIANIHFSFVAGTEGAPPIPGRPAQ
ncbi:MAG TPA: nuclear transport factor 2 family protein [Pseudonocardiaceae bacterium]|jgi:ketosteroid isomerase-like protein|nr:nuclear transport factor 2 family protein [Pseudonocardiaceae bacterium]